MQMLNDSATYDKRASSVCQIIIIKQEIETYLSLIIPRSPKVKEEKLCARVNRERGTVE